MTQEDTPPITRETNTITDDVDGVKRNGSKASGSRGALDAGAATIPRHVMEGARIKHYTIVQLLGQGGTAEVFLARDVKLQRMVALKRPFRRNASSVRRMLSEGRILARLKHENTVIVYEVNQYLGHPFMTLEYVEGQTLRATARQAGASIRLALDVMIPVLRALVHMHARDIIHHDLKPENIMVDQAGAIKIIDFDVAHVRSDVESTNLPEPKRRKRHGPRGTPRYMSPEQLRGDTVDHRTDLWAAGILLHELAYGEHPLAPLQPSWLQSLRQLDEPLPNVFRDLDGTGLADVIAQCLKKRREERMESAAELLAALERIARKEHSRGRGNGR